MGLWDRVKGYVKREIEEERKKSLKQRLKDALVKGTAPGASMLDLATSQEEENRYKRYLTGAPGRAANWAGKKAFEFAMPRTAGEEAYKKQAPDFTYQKGGSEKDVMTDPEFLRRHGGKSLQLASLFSGTRAVPGLMKGGKSTIGSVARGGLREAAEAPGYTAGQMIGEKDPDIREYPGRTLEDAAYGFGGGALLGGLGRAIRPTRAASKVDEIVPGIRKDTSGTILGDYKDPKLAKKLDQARAYKSKLEKEIPAPTRSFEPTVAKVDSLNVNTGRSDIKRAQVEKAKEAIKSGKVKPIVFDKSGGLYDGHHRVVAARELGEDSLPAVLRHETEGALPKSVEEASKRKALGAFSVVEKEADTGIKKTSLKDKLGIGGDKDSQAGFVRNPFARSSVDDPVEDLPGLANEARRARNLDEFEDVVKKAVTDDELDALQNSKYSLQDVYESVNKKTVEPGLLDKMKKEKTAGAVTQPQLIKLSDPSEQAWRGDKIELAIAPNKNIEIDDLQDVAVYDKSFKGLYRNTKKVFGEKFEIIKERLLDPFDKSKGNFATEVRDTADETYEKIVKELGINQKSKLSKLTQQYGEGKMTLSELMEETNDWKKVVEADKWFREQYNRLIDEVNDSLSKVYPNQPKKLIPKRKNYYRHFSDFSNTFKGIRNVFDSPSNISSKLAGVSQYTKPKSKFLSFALKRTGDATEEDALRGFLDYMKAAKYAKNINPYIPKFRKLAKDLAAGTEGVTENKSLNMYIEFLDDFTNDLAGKTNPLDRGVQKITGRKLFNALDWANKRAKLNVILGNLSSAVSQIGNVPAGIADAGPEAATRGMAKTLSEIFTGSKQASKSDFIKERFLSDTFDKFSVGVMGKTKDFASWITSALDRVGTKMVWDMQYERALKNEMPNPIKFADDNTRRIVAGRGVGEMPLAQKAKTTQLLAPFQLEVQNLWHTFGDWMDEKTFGKFITFMAATHLMNKSSEAIRGYGITIDPIEATKDAVATYVDADDKREGAIRVGGRVFGEVLSNVIGGQSLASAYPEYGLNIPFVEDEEGEPIRITRQEFFGEEDPTRFGPSVLQKAIQEPVTGLLTPYGGSQIEKTYSGTMSFAQGRSETPSGRVRAPVEDDFVNLARVAIFGEWNSREAREYLENNYQPLGDNQSEKFKRIYSDSPEAAFEYYYSVISDRESRRESEKKSSGGGKSLYEINQGSLSEFNSGGGGGSGSGGDLYKYNSSSLEDFNN